MQASTSPKKSSPLSFGSPRSSPFRRPESPALLSTRSPSNATVRSIADLTTPTGSPLRTPRAQATLKLPEQQPSPVTSVKSAIFSPQNRITSGNHAPGGVFDTRSNGQAGDPLSSLSTTQSREMRESFQVLDRDNDGQINREDVADMLNQLGLDSSNSSLLPFFPHSSPSTVNLNTYLSTLSNILADLSRPDELSAAFSAFDVDDSGQIDVADLRDAVLQTPAEGGVRMNERDIDRVMNGFTGRRIFKKGAASLDRGMVFRYKDFEAELQGGAQKEGDAVVVAA